MVIEGTDDGLHATGVAIAPHDLPIGWYPAGDRAEPLLAELRRELSQGHPLRGLELCAVAYRQDRDDVLFRLQDRSGRYALVHLTYQCESSDRWPSTQFFVSYGEFATAAFAADGGRCEE